MTAPNAVQARAIVDANDPTNVWSPTYNNAVSVGLTQTQSFSPPLKAFFVGTAGNVKVDTVGGQTGFTFKSIGNNSWVALRVSRIYTSGTTAKSITGFY